MDMFIKSPEIKLSKGPYSTAQFFPIKLTAETQSCIQVSMVAHGHTEKQKRIWEQPRITIFKSH